MKASLWTNGLGLDVDLEHDAPEGTGLEIWDHGNAGVGVRTFADNEAYKWLEISIPFATAKEGNGELFRTLFTLTNRYGESCDTGNPDSWSSAVWANASRS